MPLALLYCFGHDIAATYLCA